MQDETLPVAECPPTAQPSVADTMLMPRRKLSLVPPWFGTRAHLVPFQCRVKAACPPVAVV